MSAGIFEYGQLVSVHAPDSGPTKMLLKFNGQKHRVNGYKSFGADRMYTLEGCRGKNRVPYWFDGEWLREVEE